MRNRLAVLAGVYAAAPTGVADGITLPVTVWENGQLIDERAAHRVRTFKVQGKKKAAALASGTEILYLPAQFPTLESVNVYNGWFPALSRGLQLVSAFANTAVKTPVGERVVDFVKARSIGPAGGPDAAERARTRTHAVAVARDGSGAPLAEVHREGPSIYDITGELMAWAGHQLARGRGRTPGVVGPIEAFGIDALTHGCAEIGLTRSTP
ncbi:hypothetical protein AB0L13_32160 [Saccharopolyspora shandongensis]|uniref:hypothetical protein n=1 Tax=Saccharopolyspora shandongensis TaxID=418495 RepID=UPI003419BC4A